MIIIRYQRVGKKNEPSFRVVLTEKKQGAQKKYIEELGFYNPRKKSVQLNAERISYWIGCGAQISPSCHNLFVKEGILKAPKMKKGGVKAAAAEQKGEKPQGGAAEGAPAAS